MAQRRVDLICVAPLLTVPGAYLNRLAGELLREEPGSVVLVAPGRCAGEGAEVRLSRRRGTR